MTLLGTLLLMPLILTAEIRYPANPQLTDQTIYVAHRGITCFARDTLRPLWNTLPDHAADAPVVSDQAVLFGSSSGLHAVDSQTEQPLWHLFSPVTVHDVFSG